MAHQATFMDRTASSASQRTLQLTNHLSTSAKIKMVASTPAPWRSLFLSHISQLKPPTFTLSTLHPSSSSYSSSPYAASDSSSPFIFTPRARTVVFRGMWASLPANPKNTAELNAEGAYESDCLTITTDARMEKVPELFQSLEGRRDPQGERSQSGHGGPYEALFWVEETGTQWRIRGHAVIIGPDIDSSSNQSVRSALLRHMRTPPLSSSSSSSFSTPNTEFDFSFSRELTAHFGNLSPGMRGSFRNPPPGTPLRRSEALQPGLGLGQKVDNLDDEVARSNFRVVVLVPEEVDRVDLTDPEEAKRWNYRLSDGRNEDSVWETTELWP